MMQPRENVITLAAIRSPQQSFSTIGKFTLFLIRNQGLGKELR
jgi:hypothetical protein